MIRAALVVAALLVCCAPAQARPRCLGAASRDPEKPCHNPRLRLMVTPTPDEALLTGSPQCTEKAGCDYGAPPERARATVALLGDSHAAHWRGGVEFAARRLGWRVHDLSMSHCPFSSAAPAPSSGTDLSCPQHNDATITWLGEHPEVQTIVVSANRGDPLVWPGDGTPRYTYRVRSFLEEWDKLPASVTRIVVLEDDPIDKVGTFDCVRRAIRRHRDAGRACRIPRAESLFPDPQVSAARKTTRVTSVISFTPQFCSRRFCFPVVGGVLVHKDTDHIGRLFMQTLAPILLRHLRDLT